MVNTPSEDKVIDPVQTFTVLVMYFINVLEGYLNKNSKLSFSTMKLAGDLLTKEVRDSVAEVSVYKRTCDHEKYDIEARIEPAEVQLEHLKLALGESMWATLWEEALQKQTLVSKPQDYSGYYLPILRGSNSWTRVISCFDDGEIMKRNNEQFVVRISNVEKVQNLFLENSYQANATSFVYKPQFEGLNEKWLFHGTSKISPDAICLSTCGFDPRVCKETNLIGRSIHFALHSHIPVRHYAHSHGKSEYQIILARVQLGKVFETKKMTNAIRPPLLSDQRYELYDSVRVSATHLATDANKATIYGVFDSRQALPEYLITFTKVLVPKQPSGSKESNQSSSRGSGGFGSSSGGFGSSSGGFGSASGGFGSASGGFGSSSGGFGSASSSGGFGSSSSSGFGFGFGFGSSSSTGGFGSSSSTGGFGASSSSGGFESSSSTGGFGSSSSTGGFGASSSSGGFGASSSSGGFGASSSSGGFGSSSSTGGFGSSSSTGGFGASSSSGGFGASSSSGGFGYSGGYSSN